MTSDKLTTSFLLSAGRCVVLFVVFGIATVCLQARPKTPDWVTAAAAKPASFDYGKADAAVLLDESTIDVSRDGVFTTHTRWIVRLQNKDGKKYAVARVNYNTSSDRVQSFQAWLVHPPGDVTTFGKSDTADTAVFGSAQELYGEARQKIITAEDEVDAGSVFAFEAVVESKELYTQQAWYFQSILPVECSCITVNLPENWSVEGHTFNHDPIAPNTNGRSSTWELRQLQAMETEPMCPPSSARSPWQALDIRPPAGAKTIRHPFVTWSDISVFFTPLYTKASTPDPTIKSKADTLVAGIDNPWERIRALCQFAQKVNYISITLNTASAGGDIPRSATQVLRCNYGDCKDKATLLQALLRSQGITAIPLWVFAEDPDHVCPEWPSPGQFNHCILAIKVDDTVNVPAIFVHPTFGRLVIFDPTDTNMPIGWLPEQDCGGRGLILAGDKGELITLPPARQEDNITERKITAKLLANGSVSGVIEELFQGLAAGSVRDEYASRSTNDYKSLIEHWISRYMPASHVSRVEPKDDFDHAKFTLVTEFASPSHGKTMRDVLLVFKPVLVARKNSTSFKKEKRTQPIVIANSSFSENTVIELPEGFHVDELPPPVELKTAFGTYTSRIKNDANKRIILERSAELIATIIPASDYETVRTFFEKILKAEQTPVVLKRD